MFSPTVHGDPALVYVPNSMSNSVDVISQRTKKIVAQFPTGALPQHVTPSWDLKTLYVDNDLGNSLTPIDPRTARPARPIPVEDPYNLYFTPDGRFAIVVAERLQRLDFRRPGTMRLVHSLSVPACRGVDHMDFSAGGRYAYASCEFAGQMIEVDLSTQRLVRTLVLNHGDSSPQDVKLAPNGRTLYVADQINGGVWEIDPGAFHVLGFLHTGAGAHGLYPSRDARFMYVSNRQAGSISVVSFRTRRVVKTWQLPLPASPDMGGVSADGRILWLSGRYNASVYAISTRTGHLVASIPVGSGPHGLCVWPQPGLHSLGHTGIMR
jgi:DNA-binding beta-propeller fold protein YncE